MYVETETDLEKLYQSIKQVIEDEKNLRIVSEYKGTLNDIPLRSIVALNKSPKVLVGQLSEIHVSLQVIQMITQLKLLQVPGLVALHGQV
jgi:hypothetical protein